MTVYMLYKYKMYTYIINLICTAVKNIGIDNYPFHIKLSPMKIPLLFSMNSK